MHYVCYGLWQTACWNRSSWHFLLRKWWCGSVSFRKCGSVSFHVYSFDLFRLLINTICIVPIIFWQTKGYIVTAPFSWFIFNQERVDFMKLILLSLITNKNNSFKSMNEISDSVVNNSEKSLLKLLLHFYEIIKKKNQSCIQNKDHWSIL